RHHGATTTNVTMPRTVASAATACSQPSRASRTNHTTCATARSPQGIAAASAHTSGALRLGGFVGSTSVTITLSMVVPMSANTKWTAADMPDQTGPVAEELTGVNYPV
ncbi:MAG: hypothetical protein QOI01_4545, partial [Mycobacterium sp.]|nr:hypothetical protein [Mycobacterium sp.]